MINNILHELDLNRRLDPILHEIKEIKREDFKRIANITMPFLNLYKPASLCLSVGLGGMQAYALGKNLMADYRQGQWTAFGKKGCQLVLVVGSVALAILAPTINILVSSSHQIICSIYRLGCCLKEGNFKEGAQAALGIAHQVIYIGSAIYATPEILLISLVAQAAIEIYQSYHEWKNDHWLEAAGKIVMALIRLSEAASHGQTIHRNWFGKLVAREDMHIILEEVKKQKGLHPDKQVDFEAILKKFYYSGKIANVSMHMDDSETDLKSVFFKNVSFKSCDFSFTNLRGSRFKHVKFDDCDFSFSNLRGTFMEAVSFSRCAFQLADITQSFLNQVFFEECNLEHAEFARSHLKHVIFQQSQLGRVNFYKTHQEHVKFDRSEMKETCFARTNLKEVQFKACDLSYSGFNESSLKSVKIETSKLLEACFLEARIQGSKIKNADLTDCLLMGTEGQFSAENCTANTMTRPVIGLAWNFEHNGSYALVINEALRDRKAISLKFDYHMDDVNTEALDQEVKNALESIACTGLKDDEISIPDAILKRAKAGTEIGKIKQKAAAIATHMKGMILPGGEDIHPELYGHAKEEVTHTDGDYRRSMLEFALISEARQKDIPTHGICRGSQAINVFFGGTLKQHVGGQSGVQHLTLRDNLTGHVAEVAHQIVGDSINGVSMHHQASDQIGRGLTVILDYEGIPKAMISENGRFILTQFHPEMYLAGSWGENSLENNENFFDYLIGQASQTA